MPPRRPRKIECPSSFSSCHFSRSSHLVTGSRRDQQPSDVGAGQPDEISQPESLAVYLIPRVQLDDGLANLAAARNRWLGRGLCGSLCLVLPLPIAQLPHSPANSLASLGLAQAIAPLSSPAARLLASRLGAVTLTALLPRAIPEVRLKRFAAVQAAGTARHPEHLRATSLTQPLRPHGRPPPPAPPEAS